MPLVLERVSGPSERDREECPQSVLCGGEFKSPEPTLTGRWHALSGRERTGPQVEQQRPRCGRRPRGALQARESEPGRPWPGLGPEPELEPEPEPEVEASCA